MANVLDILTVSSFDNKLKCANRIGRNHCHNSTEAVFTPQSICN